MGGHGRSLQGHVRFFPSRTGLLRTRVVEASPRKCGVLVDKPAHQIRTVAMRHICEVVAITCKQKTISPRPVLVGLLLIATGCTSTQKISPAASDGYARLTEAATGKTAQVYFRDGRTLELENLYVGVQSTRGTGPNGRRRAFATTSIWKVELVNRGTGFLQGAGLGIGGPLASGAVVSLAEEDEFIPAWALGAVLSVPGGLLGGIVGAIRGQQDVYMLPKRTSPTGASIFSRSPSDTREYE